MVFNFWILGQVPAHFTLIMTVIGVFYGAAFMWMCFKVKEGEYPPPPPRTVTRNVASGILVSIGTYFKECFSKSYYVSVFIMLMTAYLCFAPINTFALPYSRSLDISIDTYGKFLALTFMVSLCLSYFLGWLADIFHPIRVSLAALIGYALVTAWGWFYATTPASFLGAWVAHGVLSGCFFTSAASLGQRLFPHDKFAQYASAASMVLAPANIALAPVIGFLIDRTGGIYRHTFAAGFVLALIAVVSGLIVYRQFIKLGGPNAYVAPV
jgi:MFS family permease